MQHLRHVATSLPVAQRVRPVFGFDSFEGLPAGASHRIGFGSGDFPQNRLRDAPVAQLGVGLFEDTLPGVVGGTRTSCPSCTATPNGKVVMPHYCAAHVEDKLMRNTRQALRDDLPA